MRQSARWEAECADQQRLAEALWKDWKSLQREIHHGNGTDMSCCWWALAGPYLIQNPARDSGRSHLVSMRSLSKGVASVR